jgi:hypothetical protein
VAVWLQSPNYAQWIGVDVSAVDEGLPSASEDGSALPRREDEMRRKYNHLYALGFSVDSDDREGATAEEIMAALWVRLLELQQPGEALEAVGVPDETLDYDTGRAVDLE